MKTSKSKTDHVVLGANSLRCLHCGREYEMAMPCSIDMMIAMSKTFNKEHKGCKLNKESMEKRGIGTDKSQPHNEMDWIRGWDTGISSETIWSVMTGKYVKSHDIPYDPSDFGRCYRLLQLFPQWKPRLPEVSAKYIRWKPFVEAWDELTALYEEEKSANKNGMAP